MLKALSSFQAFILVLTAFSVLMFQNCGGSRYEGSSGAETGVYFDSTNPPADMTSGQMMGGTLYGDFLKTCEGALDGEPAFLLAMIQSSPVQYFVVRENCLDLKVPKVIAGQDIEFLTKNRTELRYKGYFCEILN